MTNLAFGAMPRLGEIRYAYRQMARLLRPDSQSDPDLKVLTERQMKRLGEIAAILNDSRKRRECDDYLVMANAPELSDRERAVVKAVCTQARSAHLKRMSVPTWGAAFEVSTWSLRRLFLIRN